jgi:hypothetical protein
MNAKKKIQRNTNIFDVYSEAQILLVASAYCDPFASRQSWYLKLESSAAQHAIISKRRAELDELDELSPGQGSRKQIGWSLMYSLPLRVLKMLVFYG